MLSLALAIAMFPVVSLIGPLFDLWTTFGLYNTWPGLIIPYMSFTLPLAIWTLSAFFREIPWEMEQAAQVDGATPWQAFRKVIVPLAAPGVFTAAILTFFFAWNDFVFGISLTSTDKARPVPAALAFFVGPDQFNPPVSTLSAAAVVVTIPIIIIVLVFQRRIVSGLTSGAVKGWKGVFRGRDHHEEHRQAVRRWFPGRQDVSLDIDDGEFMILVGPSGCGKSTLLRMIVGLEDITSGDMLIGGERVNDKVPRERNLSMVFQNYALYPHLTVYENIAFPLRLSKKFDDKTIDSKVREAAATLELTEHLDRKPANLSGGQRQRVAMGRAIVRDAQAFLFDEPLSNLDAKLRGQMRAEIARMQRRMGITTVYVTHDQTEAMTLGDRVAVLRKGLLQQSRRLASSTSSRSTCSSPGSSGHLR